MWENKRRREPRSPPTALPPTAMTDWKASSKFTHVEGGGWAMWQAAVDYGGLQSGDKPVLQLVLGKRDRLSGFVTKRMVGKLNLIMPP